LKDQRDIVLLFSLIWVNLNNDFLSFIFCLAFKLFPGGFCLIAYQLIVWNLLPHSRLDFVIENRANKTLYFSIVKYHKKLFLLDFNPILLALKTFPWKFYLKKSNHKTANHSLEN
jgi:hypothetical protein